MLIQKINCTRHNEIHTIYYYTLFNKSKYITAFYLLYSQLYLKYFISITVKEKRLICHYYKSYTRDISLYLLELYITMFCDYIHEYLYRLSW